MNFVHEFFFERTKIIRKNDFFQSLGTKNDLHAKFVDKNNIFAYFVFNTLTTICNLSGR
jgi:hypothetical protein